MIKKIALISLIGIEIFVIITSVAIGITLDDCKGIH